MAQDYSDITYAPASSQVAPLDYSFLNFSIGQKESQYEEGANKIKSMYSSVLNSPLTNPDNVNARSQYEQQASNNLKTLSKADLSLPQNVSKASQVFAPFWSDQDMVQDMYKTKQGQAQMQELDTWKNSTDEKIRDQYSKDSERDVQNSLDRLREAKRGDGSIGKVQIQTATPVHDLVKYIDDEAKKEGFSVVQDAINGPYLVSTTNGPNAVPNFYSYAKSKLGDRFSDQFAMYGRNTKEALVRENMQLGYTREEATQKVGTEIYPQVIKPYADNYAKLLYTNAANEHNLTNLLQDIQTRQSKGLSMTPEDINTLDQYYKNKQTYSGHISELENTLNDLAKPETIEKFINNSEYYLAKAHKEQFLNDWSTGAAANENIKISANQGWYNQQNLLMQAAQLKESQREHNLSHMDRVMTDATTKRGQDLSFLEKSGGATKDGAIISNSGELTNKGDAYDVATNYYKGLRDDIANLTFSPTGLSSILQDLPTKDGGKISVQDVTNFNTYLSEKAKGNNIQNTPDINNSFNKIGEALQSKGIKVDPRKDFVQQWQDALTQYSGKFVQEVKQLGSAAPTDQVNKAIQLGTQYDRITKNVDAIENFNKEHERNINHLIQTDAYKNDPLVVNENGHKRLATTTDMAKDFVDVTVVDPKGNPITLNKQLLAEAYRKGDFKTGTTSTGQNTVTLNNQTYTLPYQYDAFSLVPFDKMYAHVKSKYGSAEQLNEHYNNLVKGTLPNKSFWDNNTGAMGAVVEYGFDKGQLGKKLIPELTSPNNWVGGAVYTKPDGTGDLTTDQKTALARLGSRPDAEDYFSKPKISTTSHNGRPIGIISVSQNAKDAKEDPDVKALQGINIYVEMSPLAKTTAWKSLEPTLRGYRLHPELAEGKPLEANSIDKSWGFDYMITPDNLYDPKGATTTMTIPTINPKTGKREDKPMSVYTPYSEQAPDKIVQNVDQMRGVMYKNYHSDLQTHKKNNGTGMTLEDYNKARGIK